MRNLRVGMLAMIANGSKKRCLAGSFAIENLAKRIEETFDGDRQARALSAGADGRMLNWVGTAISSGPPPFSIGSEQGGLAQMQGQAEQREGAISTVPPGGLTPSGSPTEQREAWIPQSRPPPFGGASVVDRCPNVHSGS